MGGNSELFSSRVRGLIWYRLSPYELKIFPSGFLSAWAKKWWIKFNRNLFYAAPPFISIYLLYNWANEYHDRAIRKPPGGGPPVEH